MEYLTGVAKKETLEISQGLNLSFIICFFLLNTFCLLY